MESEVPKPRSGGRALLIGFSGGFALLLLFVVLMAVLDRSQVTSLEQKMLGSWKSVEKTASSGEPIRYLELFGDGKLLSGRTRIPKEMSLWQWRAAGSEFEIGNVSDDWSPDWVNELLGRTKWDKYQIRFHGEDTFDLYVGTPDGELIFQRIE